MGKWENGKNELKIAKTKVIGIKAKRQRQKDNVKRAKAQTTSAFYSNGRHFACRAPNKII